MKKAFKVILPVILACYSVRLAKHRIYEAESLSNKHLDIIKMMRRWIKVRQKGKTLDEYFASNGYDEIAIYGMGYLGQSLADELENTPIHVKYGIDKKAVDVSADFEIISPEEPFERVDAVVITTMMNYNEIRNDLVQRIDRPIISLSEVLDFFNV